VVELVLARLEVVVSKVVDVTVAGDGGNFTQMRSQKAGGVHVAASPAGLNTSEVIPRYSMVKHPPGSNVSFLRCKHALKPVDWQML